MIFGLCQRKCLIVLYGWTTKQQNNNDWRNKHAPPLFQCPHLGSPVRKSLENLKPPKNDVYKKNRSPPELDPRVWVSGDRTSQNDHFGECGLGDHKISIFDKAPGPRFPPSAIRKSQTSILLVLIQLWTPFWPKISLRLSYSREGKTWTWSFVKNDIFWKGIPPDLLSGQISWWPLAGRPECPLETASPDMSLTGFETFLRLCLRKSPDDNGSHEARPPSPPLRIFVKKLSKCVKKIQSRWPKKSRSPIKNQWRATLMDVLSMRDRFRMRFWVDSCIFSP